MSNQNIRDFRDQPIFVAFFSWWLKELPQKIIYIVKKIIKKLFLFFSIDLLVKTLFLPWKRDEIDTSHLSLDMKIRVMMMNIISRLVGAVVRGGTVLVGLFSMLLVFLSGFILLVGELLVPVIVLYLLYKVLF